MTSEELEAIVQKTSEELCQIVNDKLGLEPKKVLTFNEAFHFLGISESSLYLLTMQKRIPYYNPTGNLIYYSRAELEQWKKQMVQ